MIKSLYCVYRRPEFSSHLGVGSQLSVTLVLGHPMLSSDLFRHLQLHIHSNVQSNINTHAHINTHTIKSEVNM